MKKAGSNVEAKGPGKWHFVMRLSPAKGDFYGLKSKFQRVLPVAKEHEAYLLAEKWKADLLHLQYVNKREGTGLPVSQSEIRDALRTFFWFHEIDPVALLATEARLTASAKAIAPFIKAFKADIEDFYKVTGFGGLTFKGPFGEAVHMALQSGVEPVPTLSDSLVRYHSKHRPSKGVWSAKGKRDNERYCEQFEAVVGRLSFNKIRRKDVDSYIEKRLLDVKPESVERELASLRAVWNSARNDADIDQRNPFDRSLVPGLGLQVKPVGKATLADSRKLFKYLQAEAGKSYVQPLTMLLLLTGCRLQEVWGLEQADVEETRLLIRPNGIRKLKTINSIRTIPCNALLHKWLTLYLSAKRPESSNSASASIGKFLQSKLSLPFTAHGLRHGMRDRLQESNASGQDIDELLGWATGMRQHYGNKDWLEAKAAYLDSVYKSLEVTESIQTQSKPFK